MIVPFLALFAFFAHTTFSSPLLLQPRLSSDSSRPLTSRSPYFIISVCSPTASSPFSFSTSERCFHCGSLLSLSPVFCLILSSLLFSHLVPHPPRPPSLWPQLLKQSFCWKLKSWADWSGCHRAGCAHISTNTHTRRRSSAVFCFGSPKTKIVARGKKLSLMLL